MNGKNRKEMLKILWSLDHSCKWAFHLGNLKNREIVDSLLIPQHPFGLPKNSLLVHLLATMTLLKLAQVVIKFAVLNSTLIEAPLFMDAGRAVMIEASSPFVVIIFAETRVSSFWPVFTIETLPILLGKSR